MHYTPVDSQSPAFASMQPQKPRVLGHKRRRSDASSSCTTKFDSTSSSCCTTSGESSGDESDSFELGLEVEEEEAQADAKRRRRAELDGLKKSVRRMEAQVVDASAQLRDLAALVAQVVARRQQQQQLPSLRHTHSSSTS
ncbi:hypothetical protein PR003_g13138 [Phytophthora rubi]|uniref:Uncharacterized protein n=1 Tax=Phytophthora rubi TaxID=129364 RepID=A0A6A3HWZ9_9STRA|nr:hypothetical protein PR002_g26553 [Phytophthora rubi]KAE8973224.1 hypothetical protein PR001_g26375 [Phytophthora rubi]KAE9335199.1 hypothetical protein PR003_g13138 [Phytophthora rubi]